MSCISVPWPFSVQVGNVSVDSQCQLKALNYMLRQNYAQQRESKCTLKAQKSPATTSLPWLGESRVHKLYGLFHTCDSYWQSGHRQNESWELRQNIKDCICIWCDVKITSVFQNDPVLEHVIHDVGLERDQSKFRIIGMWFSFNLKGRG